MKYLITFIVVLIVVAAGAVFMGMPIAQNVGALYILMLSTTVISAITLIKVIAIDTDVDADTYNALKISAAVSFALLMVMVILTVVKIYPLMNAKELISSLVVSKDSNISTTGQRSITLDMVHCVRV